MVLKRFVSQRRVLASVAFALIERLFNGASSQVKDEMRNTINALLGHIQTGFMLMGNELKEAIATEARDNATFAKKLSSELENFQRCG